MNRLIIVISLAACAHDRGRGEPALPERADTLCMTHGEPGAPATRGVAAGSRGDMAALRFTYRGPTAVRARLASGDLRTQLGLKLRAADSCNLIYVMWRPTEPEIVVQVKHNPGLTTHEQCGIAGYQRVRPIEKRPPPLPLSPGTAHVLSAAIEGGELAVWADHRLVWRGALPAHARSLAGPAGFRTDNADVELALHAEVIAPTRCN